MGAGRTKGRQPGAAVVTVQSSVPGLTSLQVTDGAEEAARLARGFQSAAAMPPKQSFRGTPASAFPANP